MLAPTGLAAQVSVNPGALDQLAPARPVRPARPVVSPTAAPAPPAAPAVAAEPPVVPAAPPNPPLLPPPNYAVPMRDDPPPPPPVVVDKAIGVVHPIDRGMRITFGPGSADLNHATEGALHAVAQAALSATNQPVNLLAYAPGPPEDPSTPRRLALARGLAARAVLINLGVASTRIYVRTNAPSLGPDGPADRLDAILGPLSSPEAPPK